MSTEQTAAFDMGAAITDSVVAAFWKPTIANYTSSMPQPNGMWTPPIPVYTPSPLDQLTKKLQDALGNQIVTKVYDQLNLDDIAERAATRVADQIVDELSKESGGGWGYRQTLPKAEDIQNRVREKVAEKLSGRALDEYDARQAAMWDAYQREQQREREQGQLAGDGETDV